MSSIKDLVMCYEDMVGESGTEVGDAARVELEQILVLLKRCVPFVDDMIGIASDARFLKAEINSFLMENQ